VTPRGVAEIRALLARLDAEELRVALDSYADDGRAGVRTACAAASSRLKRAEAETSRLESLYALETQLRREGCAIVAGVDEVGRGALAGPLTAAAVVLPPSPYIVGLNDSKLLAPARRERVAEDVRSVALHVSVAHVPAADVDAMGMTKAVRHAMLKALMQLVPAPDHLLVDGLSVGLSPSLLNKSAVGPAIGETAIVKGDSRVAAIAAASVVAKVERDALMRELAFDYPEYEFDKNKGYGSAEHLAAIARVGLTPAHRRSFAPCGGTLPLF